MTFGRYELLDRVSAGGMAEVFRARDTARGTVVALKRILPQIAADEEFIAMFEDEARIVSTLEHPHIARTLDFGHVKSEYFIAFEFVDGKDLRRLYDRSVKEQTPAPLEVLLYVFARIGEGLSYAHSRKDPESGQPTSLVHRDVSPQNIVISYTGDVKLIDFGIAKAANKVTRTQAGTIKGKFGYMSPEQVRGVEIDHRTDIFALGICMWELFTRQRLFAAENELLVLDRIRNMTVVAPSSFNPDVTPELDRIILKALAKDPNERYRATKDLYRDLNALPESTGTREDVSKYMRRVFPETAPAITAATGSDAESQRPPRQETRAMAAENKSDLDIFEGLGKKSGSVRASSSSVPAPPRSSSSMPALTPVAGSPVASDAGANKKTLLGMTTPASASNVPTVGARPAPPPPPGRGQLPQVVPPPPHDMRRGSAPPPPRNGNPGGNGRGALDMDWDDEDETTHVFDKGDASQGKMAAVAPAMDSSPPSSQMPGRGRTLLGVSAPLAAPPPPPPPPTPSQSPFRSAPPPLPPASTPPFRSGGSGHPSAQSQPQFRTPPPPPPPPASGGAFARASSPPGSGPYGNGGAANPSTTPLRVPGSMPPAGSGSTAPMPMPGRPSPAVMGAMASRSIEATALVRPQAASRTGLWVALGVVFIAIVAGAVYMTTPKTGRVVVNVTDEKGAALDRVEIFIDGKKMCDTAPCFIEPVNAGAHEVKVISEGYDVPPARGTAVEARKDAVLSFALTSAAASKGGTGIKVSGSQSGVKLLVDDKEIGPLPQEIRDLSPGSHKIKLMGSDRYAPMEKNITVAQNEVQDLGPQVLKVVKGKATITLGTPGAKVYIVSGADRHEVPTFPISIDIDTSKPWSLEATKPGFVDYKQQVAFDDGQAEKSFAIALDVKSSSAAATPVAAAPQAPVSAPPAPKEPTPAAPKAPVAAKDPPKAPAPKEPDSNGGAAAATGESFLDINSMPSSSVVLDGKPIGNTPRLHVPVSPGTHAVLFVNAEQGLKKTVSVSVGAGETKKAIAKLRE